VEPYLRTNLWHTFGGKDTTTYNGLDRIKTEHKASPMDVGMGVVAKVSEGVSVYVSADYAANLDGEVLEGVSGVVGVRVSW
jgi:outer membrane autotransporter protein